MYHVRQWKNVANYQRYVFKNDWEKTEKLRCYIEADYEFGFFRLAKLEMN